MDIAELGLIVDSRGMVRANKELRELEQRGGRVQKTADTINAAFASLATRVGGVVTALAGANALFNASQQYTSMSNSLRSMGLSADQATASLDAVAGIAQRTRAPLEATADLYQRISIAGRELGVNQQQVLRFTENVGLALAQSGGGAAEAAGALTQLSQAMAGGTVRAEEFNSILDGAYPVALAAARGLDEAGGSVGKLRNLVVEGEISSREFFDALLSQTDSLTTAFGNTVPTISQAFSVLSGSVTMAVGKLNEASGASEAVARAILAVADGIYAVSGFISENMDAITAGLGQAAAIAGVAATAFGVKLAVSVGTTYVAAAIAAVRQTIALEMALGATSRASAVASAGVKLFSASLRVMKGALISTGIGALVVAAGEAVYWFGRLVSSAGGFGAALGLLGDVAGAVWQGMIDSAAAIPPGLNGVWDLMKAGFLTRLSEMATSFHDFIWRIANGMQQTEALKGMGDSLMGVAQAASEASGSLWRAGHAAEESAAGALENAAGTISEAFGPAREAVGALVATVKGAEGAMDDGTTAAEQYNAAVGGLGGGSGSATKAAAAAKALQDKIEQLEFDADPVKKYNAGIEELNTLLDAGLSQGAYDKAVADLNDELADSLPMVNEVSDAFSNWLQRGLSDFNSFAQDIWGGFKSLLANMITTAARNRILIGMGFGGAGGIAGTAASAAGMAQGGGGLMGMLGGGAGAAGSGILGSVGSVLGAGVQGMGLAAGSFLSGGLSGMAGTIGTQVGLAASTGSMTAIAGAVGAVAAPLLAVGAAVSFFSKKTEELDSGIRVTVNGIDALVETFKKTKTSRFWGLSSSIDKTFKAAADDIANPIEAAVAGVGESVSAVAASLGLSSDALADVAYQFKISTDGLSDEELTEKLEDAMRNIGNTAAEAIVEGFGQTFADMQLADEEALDTLQRLSQHLSGVNAAFDTLGQQMFYIGLQGADMASQLVQLFGSLDDFNTATSAYYQAFYGEAERLAILTRQTTDALADLGYAMPGTREQFRAMVEGLDLTSEKGRETYAALISMSGALDQILPSINDFAAVMSGLIGSTSSAVTTMITEASAMANDAARAASDWLRASETLRDFIHDLTASSNSSLSAQQQLAALTRDMNAAFTAAQGGDIDAARSFTGMAGDYLDAARAQASSALEYRRIESSVKAQANLLAGISELEAASQTAVEHLAQQQVDVLNELNDYIQSGDQLEPEDLAGFEDRLGSLQAAIEQAEMFSYEYLKERLKVTVDLLPEANIPADVKKLISTAANGIESSIEFAVRAEHLTPDLRWLAITGASEHIKTLDFVVGKDVDNRTKRLALDTIKDLTRTVNLTMGSRLSHDEMSVALAGNSELSRVVNVALSSGADRQAIQIALRNSGSYSVAVRTALSASKQVREVVFGNSGSYAAMIEAAFSSNLSGAERRVLLERQGIYAVTVNAVLNRNVSSSLKRVLLNASTSAVRGVTVGMAFKNSVSASERELLLKNSATIQRIISGKMALSGISGDRARYLREIYAGSGSINRILNGRVDLSKLNTAQRSLLEAVQGGSVGNLRLGGSFTFNPSKAFEQWYNTSNANQIGHPMNALRQQITNLRSAVIENSRAVNAAADAAEKAQKITALQNSLSAAVQSNSTLPSQGQAIIDQIEALERSTGVDLRHDNGDAILRVGPNGRIQYDASHYNYGKGDDLTGFRSTFYGSNGLQAQIGKYNASVNSSASTIESLRRQIRNLGGVPAFATGGLHSGGLRIVGENGPELEATGSARYYSAPQTRGLLGGGEQVSELRRLRKELAELRDTMTQLGLNQSRDLSKLRRLAEKEDRIGTPPERSTA